MNPFTFTKKACKYLYRETVLYAVWHFASYFPLFPTIMYSKMRAKAWRFIGAKVGKKVYIGYGVYLDVSSAARLQVDDYVGIGAQTLVLLHKIDMKQFKHRRVGIPIQESHIHICTNVQVGMRSILMPGVTIGEGSFVAAGSTVTKDVPPYSVVAGCPAKVIGQIYQLSEEELQALLVK